MVPVYKVEQYLHRCVDSILGQTFRDFELILVDDGSPDNCGEICEEYARRDSRVRVIHQENAGLSAARNTAIDLLLKENRVEWLTFIDSDDWIHPKMLECLLTAAKEQGTQIACCGYEETSGADPVVSEDSLTSVCLTAKEYYLKHCTNATIACAKLYQKSCFETLRYPMGKIHEDEFVTYRLLFASQKVSVIFSPLYAYYVNHFGITKKPWAAKRLDAWEAYDQQIAYFKAMGDQELVSFRTREYLENALNQYDAAEQASATEELKGMRRIIRRLIRMCWHSGRIAFWPDFDFLVRFYPILSRIYRIWMENTR